jgi:AcrR family transcriptional regulator
MGNVVLADDSRRVRASMRRGDQTREHILDCAEQLFAAEGIGRVSMRQIRIAADQRNEGAVQYHFGDLDGVIRALVERHTPRVQQIQERIIKANGSNPTLRKKVNATFRPMAEYCTQSPSERAWARIMADLISDPTLSFAALQEGTQPVPANAALAVYEDLCTKLPADIAGDRLWAVTQFVIHVTADRARLHDDPKASRPLSSENAFIDNLLNMAYGALTARER